MLLALAPMKDVTDLAMMRVLARLDSLPDYFITEYFRSNMHAKKLDQGILDTLRHNPTNRPIFGQLMGNEPEALVKGAHLMLKENAAGVDFNMGCPAPFVCRRLVGGGILKTPSIMRDCLHTLRETLPAGTFSVKCRIGWESPDEWTEILDIIASSCPDRVVVHARTVREGYRTHVHTNCVREAVARLSCPVMANGNIVDLQTAQTWLQASSPAGLMIGRGAIRNPWIFNQLRSWQKGVYPAPITRRDLLHYITLLHEETGRLMHPCSELKHITRLKKFLVYITWGLPVEFDHAIRRARDEATFFSLCREYLDHDIAVAPLPEERVPLFASIHELAATKA